MKISFIFFAVKALIPPKAERTRRVLETRLLDGKPHGGRIGTHGPCFVHVRREKSDSFTASRKTSSREPTERGRHSLCVGDCSVAVGHGDNASLRRDTTAPHRTRAYADRSRSPKRRTARLPRGTTLGTGL
ncbi:MAG: hypothetical protein A3A28_02260 [Candidatus Sungbacteria bacterium RIFCSPLOWO2_01_FULL_47_32]|uniref:Uncharacterized protein n=1 Tax=Candidatus Sungbacteria bacterium RIFCSPHIGHO2_01_FULL_47_32 TaxID=1802264 RepID=A0A1G2K7N1_9BACT|nr:MAG: hypothetical protein A2633_05940 [Candidatus Sungbacteria bacterium RIFCSPHIGHO2_01_FULL_47_32]OHA06292.1 MAG: hypothetical protein A3A28_02260 [Candidatus Sungbacteria bacterium RIFCSPLOWO2_01_FULL_47_32]